MHARILPSILLVALVVFVPSLHAASILVRSGVPEAIVRLDNRDFGRTDRQGLAFISGISPGSHQLTISKRGYETYSEDITVKDKLTTIVEVTLAILDQTPPEIKLISPEPTRGIRITSREESIQIIGLARDEGEVVLVSINGQEVQLSLPSNEEMKLLPGKTVKFISEVSLGLGNNTVQIEAVDKAGNHATLEQYVERERDLMASLNMGCQALLIGIDRYEHWSGLSNPITDVRALNEELRENYGFQTEILLNPTASEIRSKIRSYYKQQFSENGELLIVLSGHGHFDELSKIGYFVAADGLRPGDDPNFETYIGYPILQTVITNIPCKHILVVIDACFAGTFFPEIAMKGEEDVYRELPPEEKIIRKLKYKSRILLTSGGNEYVPDGRPGHHSPFMRKVLEGLRNYGGRDNILSVEELKVNYMDAVNPQPFLVEFQGNEPGSSFLFIAR